MPAARDPTSIAHKTFAVAQHVPLVALGAGPAGIAAAVPSAPRAALSLDDITSLLRGMGQRGDEPAREGRKYDEIVAWRRIAVVDHAGQPGHGRYRRAAGAEFAPMQVQAG